MNQLTLIEFFDRIAIDNLAGAILLEPKKVIFVGNSIREMNAALPYYKAILEKRGLTTVLEPMMVNRNNLSETLSALERIVDTHENCVFDLEGGDEMYLVATGMILAKRDNIQCHRINLNSGRIQDCDMDGNVCKASDFDISLEEYIHVSGGEIIRQRDGRVHTYGWDFTPELEAAVKDLWSICAANNSDWNRKTNTLDKLGECFNLHGKMTWCFSPEDGRRAMAHQEDNYYLPTEFLRMLHAKGYLSQLTLGEKIQLTFRDENIRRILTNAGQLLELYVAHRLRGLTVSKRDRSPLCHDVSVGVHIDWNDLDDEKRFQSVNEIDVMAMKDAIPVFISCKNGNLTVDELYKLRTVADRFGRGYAISILVMPDPDTLGSNGQYILTRATDMGIKCIHSVHEKTPGEFSEELSGLIKS